MERSKREDGTIDGAMLQLSTLTERQTINKEQIKRITPKYLKDAIQKKIFSMRDITDIIYMENGAFVNIDVDMYAKLSPFILREFERVDMVELGFNITVVDEYNIYCDEYKSYFFQDDGYIISKCETIADVIQFFFIVKKYDSMISILNRYHYWKLDFSFAPVKVRFTSGEVVVYEFLDDFENDFFDTSLL